MVSAIYFIDSRVTGELDFRLGLREIIQLALIAVWRHSHFMWHHVLAVILDSINGGQESRLLASSLSAPDGGYDVSRCSKPTHYTLELGAEINGFSCAAAVGWTLITATGRETKTAVFSCHSLLPPLISIFSWPPTCRLRRKSNPYLSSLISSVCHIRSTKESKTPKSELVAVPHKSQTYKCPMAVLSCDYLAVNCPASSWPQVSYT